MRKVILHYHLFKNAGTSLDAILKTQFPNQWVTKEFSGAKSLIREDLATWIQDEIEAVCFSSHTAALPLLELPDIEILPLIFIRHPIDRIASVYQFEKRQGGDGYGPSLARSTDLKGYIHERMPHDRQCRNFHTYFLANYIDGVGMSELDRSILAVNELPFVGLVESFGQSMAILKGLLAERGYGNYVLQEVRKNVTSDPAMTLEQRLKLIQNQIGESLFSEVLEQNQDDLMLYQVLEAKYQKLSLEM